MAIERDFRKLGPATQAELRPVAVAIVAAGKTRIEAAARVDVNRRFVGQWVKTAPCCTDRADWRRALGGVGRRLLSRHSDLRRAVRSQGSLSPPYSQAAASSDELGGV
jgi:hypothetical protein